MNMNKRRVEMTESLESLGWCAARKCITANGDTVIISVNEGSLAGCSVNGKDREMTWKSLAQLVNKDYDLYRGCSDSHIALDAKWETLPCCECPWFMKCDAMDDE